MGTCSSCETVCSGPGEEAQEFKIEKSENRIVDKDLSDTSKSAVSRHRAPSGRQYASSTNVAE